MCRKSCATHEQPKCGSGCDECQLEIQTKAFSAALAAQGVKLLDKEQTQENPA